MKTATPLLFLFVTSAASFQQPSPATELFKRVEPSVVLIEMKGPDGKIASTGSGFVVSADGKIVTNFHVISGARKGTVRLSNGDAYDSIDVIEIDQRRDLALIKINAVDLPTLPLGRSSALQVGEQLFVVSNPLGLTNTMSQGLISAKRQMDGYTLFQISAPISEGSSGGPVFDSKGNVIGVAVLTIPDGQNLNFAIPIDYVRGMLQSNSRTPLAQIYDERPAAPSPNLAPTKPTTDSTASIVATEQTSAANPAVLVPRPSEGMRKGSLGYVGSRMFQWTLEDAKVELGAPTGIRPSLLNGQETGKIYAFVDPTRGVYSFELTFANSNGLMTGVFGYPVGLTLDHAKKLFGENYRVAQKAPNGEKLLAYTDRRIILRVDKKDKIISIGLF